MIVTKEILDNVKVLWDYHRIDDKLIKSDLIFCLGSIDIRSAQRAVNLYNTGYSDTLLFSGGIAHSDDMLRTTWKDPEAIVFANEAIRLGVPKENILLETKARNTGENIIYGYQILKDNLKNIKSMIFVQKPYMGRRTFATFKKQWPGSKVNIMVTSPQISFDEYFHVEDSERNRIINIMVGDLQRIKEYPVKGYQIYQEIPENVMKAYEYLVNKGYTAHLIY